MKRRGLTLIEMLIATVMAALLISAELSIAARLSQDRQLLSKQLTPPPPRGLIGLMRWDLSQADHCEVTETGDLVLIGHGAIDAATLTPSFRYVQVIYSVGAPGTEGALLRQQRMLDEPAASGTENELIARGIHRIELQPSPDPATHRLAMQGQLLIESAGGTWSVDWHK